MTDLPNLPGQQNDQEERPFADEQTGPAIPPFAVNQNGGTAPSVPNVDGPSEGFAPPIPPSEEPPSTMEQPLAAPEEPAEIPPQQTQQPLPNEQPTPLSAAQPTMDPTQASAPSEVDAYKPLEVQAQVAEISPGKFDNLTKVLDILRQNKPDAITIKGSYIYEGISGAIIVADVRKIFEDKAVDFQITDPKKHVDLFKSFKGNNNVFILDDPENTRFILTNGPIKLFLPKQVDQLVADTTAPDVSQATTICQKNINKDVRAEIKGLGKHSNSIEYLIQSNEIKAMHIPDTGIYRFEQYVNDPGVAKLDETNADLVLKSEMFLPVESDNYKIHICKLPTGEHLSITECNTGLIGMWIFEQLEDTTGGNISF
jgi:hypothetical protein